MTPEQFFRKLLASKSRIKNDLLSIIEVEAEKFVNENFESEGFTDTNFEAWQPRKDTRNDRQLLIRTGDLKRAATTARRKQNAVEFVLNLPYAQVHNEGSDIMPKRQYIGRSKVLEDLIELKMRKRLVEIIEDISS